MKRSRIQVWIARSGAGASALLLIAACGRSAAPVAADGGPTVASVGSHAIDVGELRRWVGAQPVGERLLTRPGGAERAVEEMIELELAEHEAHERGIERDPQVAAKLERIETRAHREQQQVLRGQLLERLQAEVELSDAAVRDYYAQNTGRWLSPRLTLRRIAVQDEAQARAAAARIRKGERFEVVAAELNGDPELRARGGELGRLERAAIPAELRMVALGLREGQVSEPFATAAGSWNLLQLVTREPAVPRELESVRAQIEQELRRRAAQQRLAALLEQRRGAADVQIDAAVLATLGPPPSVDPQAPASPAAVNVPPAVLDPTSPRPGTPAASSPDAAAAAR